MDFVSAAACDLKLPEAQPLHTFDAESVGHVRDRSGGWESELAIAKPVGIFVVQLN
jgi:hypothetical protein